jgi:OmpA-OmpF porin, OOP family
MRRLASSLVPLALVLGLAPGCGGSRTAPPAAPAADPPAAKDGADSTATASGDRPRFTTFEVEDNQLVLPGPIAFATGSSDLDVDASTDALWYVHDYLEAKDYITLVRIEGHGDVAGEDALMQTGDRALAVGRWLVANGIDCKRLLAAAFGDTKPIADPSTAEGRAQNRRITVVNAELRGRAIGGMPVDGGAIAVPVCD